ncbi:similar to vacuolar ATPase assembly integral membrane protein VMA21 [Botrytis cinerea T4]|uniref:Similar to vacuolar ATPase assembly integral membrane protein VMA21 n=1 Tax=Botryotinia fuckeliana (strain T4) TaxID=999810 RepID=G2XN92_BOTF4|nr:similar to vacuolar ATPase assembly integral membrane protein VMA21 [Botrytis cinerea T4]
MATQRRTPHDRIAAGEEKEAEFKPIVGGKSNIAPAVPAHVIFKLLGFTLAMIVVPIGSYFLTLNYVYRGNSTFAGATAAIMANVVLIGYVIVAMKEDQSEALEAAAKEEESKKSL